MKQLPRLKLRIDLDDVHTDEQVGYESDNENSETYVLFGNHLNDFNINFCIGKTCPICKQKIKEDDKGWETFGSGIPYHNECVEVIHD